MIDRSVAPEPQIELDLKPVEQWRTDICAAIIGWGASLQKYRRRSFVFRQGEPPECVYAIKSGLVEIVGVNELGRDVAHSIRGPVEVFGFSEMVLNEDRKRSVVVLDDAEIHALPRCRFLQLMAARPDIVLALLGSTLHRSRSHQEMRVYSAGSSALHRVAYVLTHLTRRLAKATCRTEHITLPVTHEELGHYCELSRQTVSSILGSLQDMGVIDLRSRAIVVRDLGGLEGIIENLDS